MLRKLAAVAAAGLLGALTFAGPAQAEESTQVFSNEVISAPDNFCPTWARDTFTRTTRVTEVADGEYDILQRISGTFTTTAEPIFTGTLTGFVTYTVEGTLMSDLTGIDGATVDLSDVDCKSNLSSDSVDRSGNWALRFFEPGATAGPITDWGYVYATPCQVFVENNQSGAVGADTFHPCDPDALEEIAVTVNEGDCGQLTFATAWDTDRPHTDNAALVVRTEETYEIAAIGDTITVGPFEAAEVTVQYRVWGGGERDYDSPALADLAALVAYLEAGGGELDEGVPGVAWHELVVEGCPVDDGTGDDGTGDDGTGDDGTGGGDIGDDDKDLPATGAPMPLMVGGGLALLLAGVGAMLLARRRRGIIG